MFAGCRSALTRPTSGDPASWMRPT
jgi:hypothetical protein